VSHLSPAHRLAAGLHADPSLNHSFAATQAAWRFYRNQAVTLPLLAGSLIRCAAADVPEACDRRLLVVLDWSNLHYRSHDAKADRVGLSRRKDLGYELLTALAVSDRDGAPIAPLCLDLRAADGVHSTRADTPLQAVSALDGLTPVMEHVRQMTLPWDRTPLFIIDREADSVGHFRQWDQAGCEYLVRADEQRRVLHEGEECRLGDLPERLERSGMFAESRRIEFKGRPARQWVAETTVTLHRAARTHRVDKKTGKAVHKNIAGVPLALR
jgi:hypothetical protein